MLRIMPARLGEDREEDFPSTCGEKLWKDTDGPVVLMIFLHETQNLDTKFFPTKNSLKSSSAENGCWFLDSEVGW